MNSNYKIAIELLQGPAFQSDTHTERDIIKINVPYLHTGIYQSLPRTYLYSYHLDFVDGYTDEWIPDTISVRFCEISIED